MLGINFITICLEINTIVFSFILLVRWSWVQSYSSLFPYLSYDWKGGVVNTKVLLTIWPIWWAHNKVVYKWSKKELRACKYYEDEKIWKLNHYVFYWFINLVFWSDSIGCKYYGEDAEVKFMALYQCKKLKVQSLCFLCVYQYGFMEWQYGATWLNCLYVEV
jgi:hypothetical protein